MKNAVWVSIAALVLSSCTEKDFYWDTSRANPLDIKNGQFCFYNDCSSLLDVSSYVEPVSASDNASWVIDGGYTGTGWAIMNAAPGGYVEFTVNANSQAKLTFWTRSLNPGYANITPELYVDGILYELEIIDGETTYTKWMQVESTLMEAGNHLIKINFPNNSTYAQYFIDEIRLWCK
jgi:hypothetical protein